MKNAILIALFILLPSSFIFAKQETKVLVYYFKNISGDDSYSDMMYKLPICIYTNIKEKIPDKQFTLIDGEGLKNYRTDSPYELWESDLLLNIALLRGIHEVIFGQFYVENGRPVVLGKVFYIESGLIIAIGEGQKEYNDQLRAVEKLSVEEIMDYDIEEKEQVYNPEIKRFIKTEVLEVHNNVSVSGGIVVPVGDWIENFDTGISGELFYNLFPKIEVFPLGFGLSTGFVYISRNADESHKETELTVLPVGVLVRYLFSIKGFLNAVTIDLGGGMGVSTLAIEDEPYRSIDPYIKVGVSLILNPLKDHYLSLKFGYMNIAYMDTPLSSLIGEMGVIFHF
ncbi:MAG: hypothetical protein JSV25_05385 [Spirochaetota bacterium]|nr:MAG: hypothetical protein JSV25_05385 [Spirochaetota bacterium]